MNHKTGQDGQSVRTDADASLPTASRKKGKHVVRKSIRVPVPKDLVTLVHGDLSFAVKDLSMYGVGLSVQRPDALMVGSVLTAARIIFPDQSFLVDIRVVHISACEGDSLVCGLEIINTHDSGYIDWMTRVIAEIKSSTPLAVTSS